MKETTLRSLVAWLKGYSLDVHYPCPECKEDAPKHNEDCPWNWVFYEARKHGIRREP